MRHASLFLALWVAATAVGADVGSTIDVPGAAVLKVAIKSPAERDLLARQDVTASLLANIVRVQAGDRARTKAFTATESARIAELETFRSGAENSYLQTLPPQCAGGRDCEERFAFYRCVSAYTFSSEFYRAVFDRFFTVDQQKALAPRLQNSGTVWQGALAMARNSHPFDQFPAPSRECIGVAGSSSERTAGAATGQTAVAATAEATAADDSVRRARAAGVDVTVLGLTLGQPVSLPVCEERSLFGIFGPDIRETCIVNNVEVNALTEDIAALLGSTASEAAIPYDLTVQMPRTRCPDWVAGCTFTGHLSNGRLTAVYVPTTGLDKQKDIGAALTQKYKNPTQSFWKEWTNAAGGKVYALNMIWRLQGLNVTFQGYNGGDRNANGSLLIETDAITREREQLEKAKQDAKQKL
jgi:hypothetical protein